MCTISPILNEVMGNENITLYTLSEVEELKGRPGDYKLKVMRRARYVDESKCTGCGECEKHCFTRLAPQIQDPVDWGKKLTPEEKAEADAVIDRYKAAQMHLISILHDVQKRFNYLPRQVLGYVAQRLDVPLSRVYHVATFYTAFSLEPRGKHHIKVCTGTSCHVRGAAKVLDEVKGALDLKEGQTTKDGEYSLETVACIGCCALSPCMVVDNEVHAKLTPTKARELFKR
jgi:NADH-quinone oxidoreductase subunit E